MALGNRPHEPASGLPANCEFGVWEADKLRKLTNKPAHS